MRYRVYLHFEDTDIQYVGSLSEAKEVYRANAFQFPHTAEDLRIEDQETGEVHHLEPSVERWSITQG